MLLGLGACIWTIQYLAAYDSGIVEFIYSRGLFVWYRWIWDYTFGLSPIPLIYIAILACVAPALIDLRLELSCRKNRGGVPVSAIPKKRALMSAGLCILTVALIFHGFWGFNYKRVSIEKQLGLELKPPDAETIRYEAEVTALALSETRALIPHVTDVPLGPEVLSAGVEDELRRLLSGLLVSIGYPAPGNVRVRDLWPGGLMLRLAFLGIYFPLLGEGYIAGNLPSYEKPALIAHEMVHAFGISDEGAANFLAHLACKSSSDPVIRYSGLLRYWNYIFRDFLDVAAEDAMNLYGALPVGVRADMTSASVFHGGFNGVMSRASVVVNDRALKAHGVEEGIEIYHNKFVSLLTSWERHGDASHRL